MKQAIVPLLILTVFAAPLLADERFKLVVADTPERLERRVDEVAASGYRLLSADRGKSLEGKGRVAALLELTDTRYDYSVISCTGSLRDDDSRMRVNELGKQGYRLRPAGVLIERLADFWLPESAYDDQMLLVLEKAAAESSTYEYDAINFGSHDRFYASLTAKRAEGFEILGMWNSGRNLQLILERQGDATPVPTAVMNDPEPYRMLIMATRSILKTKLKRAASRGYRVVAAADPTVTGPPILLLERSAENPKLDFDELDYRFLDDLPDRIHRDKLEAKLNKKARKGWRVAVSGTTRTFLVLERKSKKDPPAKYLVLTPDRAPGLALGLDAALERGYRLLAMLLRPSGPILILENRVDAAAAEPADGTLQAGL